MRSKGAGGNYCVVIDSVIFPLARSCGLCSDLPSLASLFRRYFIFWHAFQDQHRASYRIRFKSPTGITIRLCT